MRLPSIALLTALAAFAALSFAPPDRTDASSPPAAAIPILDCADVNGDGGVTAGDLAKVVSKFGTATGGAGYHPLFDIGMPVGTVSAGDLASAVLDFGIVCPAIDTEVAQAALWVIDDHPGLLTLNVALLNSLGYYNSSLDVPGQGVHYVNPDNSDDGIFDPAAPEGLVYFDGNAGSPLGAQLYIVQGDIVGWGTWPTPDGKAPPDQINIDAFCVPEPGETACSWAGDEDGWHWHRDLCTIHIGTPSASNTFADSAEACEAINNTTSGGGDWNWNHQVGWMGHAWVHFANPNGRFADCFPDGFWNWKAFTCPQ
ncbi:MAG: hypothetical protein WEE64_10915 [Dehalococcoidia bacterium]